MTMKMLMTVNDVDDDHNDDDNGDNDIDNDNQIW